MNDLSGLLILFLIFLVFLWILLPFAVFGIKHKLDEIIELQKQTNELLRNKN